MFLDFKNKCTDFKQNPLDLKGNALICNKSVTFWKWDEFNETKLVDIIYDNDKTLIGLGIQDKGLEKNETKLCNGLSLKIVRHDL